MYKRIYKQMNLSFFEIENYLVQKKNFFYHRYLIFNEKREGIGSIKLKLSGINRLFNIKPGRSIFPFLIEIRSENGKLEATVFRKGFLVFSKIIITNCYGEKVGSIKKDFSFFQSRLKVINVEKEIIAEIAINWKNRSFIINDSFEKQIGLIDKKIDSNLKKNFKNNEDYKVHFKDKLLKPNEKIAIVSSAITIDLMITKN